MQLFRYPGGKSRLITVILRRLCEVPNLHKRQFREPFFGGGSIGLALFDQSQLGDVWVNDKDPGIAALWTTVIHYPDRLNERILGFKPSVDAFNAFKQELLNSTALPDNPDTTVDLGFKKLALHQTSFSGLGTKSGGPLGGRRQRSTCKIDSRWSPQKLCRKVSEFHRRFAAVGVDRCTCLDFSDLIEDETCDSLLFLDPPYVKKGNHLYQCGFTEEDHARLAMLLRQTPHPWVLSYDDCPLVRDLYPWAQVEEVAVGYSISGPRRTSELLITPRAKAVHLPVSVPNHSDGTPFSLAS